MRQWVGKYAQAGTADLLECYANSAQNARKLSQAQIEDWRNKLHSYRPNQVLASDEYQGTGQFWRVADCTTGCLKMVWRELLGVDRVSQFVTSVWV